MDPRRTDLIELLVLHTLEDRPLHGYGVYKELAVHLGDDLTSGKVYSILNRMEDDGLARSRSGEGRRRVYELTDEGQAVLDEVRAAPDSLKTAVAELFALDRPEGAVDLGRAWQDVTVHRDLVRDKVTITLERGDADEDTRADQQRFLDRLLRALLGQS